MEDNMRSKLLGGAAAIALTACTVLASAGPASAQRWHRGPFGWGAGIAAGVIGGAVAAATSPLWAPGYYGNYPGYAYGPAYGYGTYDYVAPPAAMPGPAFAGGDVAYCEQRFRSYDPASGTYLGFDGLRHPCP
jgi:hypothetical protein